MRVMMRGQMGPRMGRGGGFLKSYILRPTFDIHLCENSFPRIKSAPDESLAVFQQALLKKNTDLTPSQDEQTAILSLITKIANVLDSVIVSPGGFDACQIDEHRQVGSYKKGTMRTGSNVADIIAILKTLPTKEAVEALAKKVHEEMKQRHASDAATMALLSNDGGFSITVGDASVRVMVTTVHQNLRKLDPELHIDQRLLRQHLAAIRHSRWFEENAHHSSIRVLVRLLRDLQLRFPGLSSLSPWMLDLLAHYSILNNPSRQALAINAAYRRCLQLLASGIFLPGSSSILDPCETGGVRVHVSLTLEQQDVVCMTAQTLLRVLSHGGYKQLVGVQPDRSVANDMSVWDSVVVSPMGPVYDASGPHQPTSTEEEDASVDMDVADI